MEFLSPVKPRNFLYISYKDFLFFRSRKTHPGPVVHLSDNPLDPSKVRIYCTVLSVQYGIICFKRQLTNRQNKGLKDRR